MANVGRPDHVASLLNKDFPKLEGESGKAFMKFAGATEGDVWAVKFPKGKYAVISEPKGCHVVVQKADGPEIHKVIRKVAEHQQFILPSYSINYRKPHLEGAVETSGFDVLLKTNEHAAMRVDATTLKNAPPERSLGILTMRSK